MLTVQTQIVINKRTKRNGNGLTSENIEIARGRRRRMLSPRMPRCFVNISWQDLYHIHSGHHLRLGSVPQIFNHFLFPPSPSFVLSFFSLAQSLLHHGFRYASTAQVHGLHNPDNRWSRRIQDQPQETSYKHLHGPREILEDRSVCCAFDEFQVSAVCMACECRSPASPLCAPTNDKCKTVPSIQCNIQTLPLQSTKHTASDRVLNSLPACYYLLAPIYLGMRLQYA